MNPLVAANAVLRFVLELCMLAGLAVAFAVTAAVNTTLVHLLGEI